MKQFLYKCIYFLGRIPFFYKYRDIDSKAINKILIISLYFRGDALFHTPAITLLHHLFPLSKIDVWTKSRNTDIFRNNPYVNEVLIFDNIKTASYNESNKLNLEDKLKFIKNLRGKDYDLLIDLTGKYSTAIISFLSRAKNTIGLNYNGFGFLYNKFWNVNTFASKGHLIDKYLDILKYGLAINDSRWANIVNDINISPSLIINEEISVLVKNNLSSRGIEFDKPIICIHTTAGWKAKYLPPATFSNVINKLVNKLDCNIILLGSIEDETNIEEVINGIADDSKKSVTKYISSNMTESAEIIRLSDVFLGSDSLPLHLAGAFNTPSVGLFGPTNPEFSKPKGDIHRVIYYKLVCSADDDNQYCTRNGGRTCPLYECMNSITADEVVSNILSAMNKLQRV